MNRPILFNTEMVQAIQAGCKTQTRRIVKELGGTPLHHFSDGAAKRFISHGKAANVKASPCEPGDILWVRETWQHAYTFDDNDQPVEGSGRYIYYADSPMPFDYWVDVDTGEHKEQMPWKPSIHMPKAAARLFLRVKDVRMERLKDISIDDCKREGIWDDYKTTSEAYHDALVNAAYPKCFAKLWDSTVKPTDRNKHGWDANPWVWVIEFERCDKPEGWDAQNG